MTFRLFAFALAAVVLCVGWAASCVIWRAAEVNELVGPVEQRQYGGLTIVAVGTGSPYENPERRGPATGIAWKDTVSLVDVGRGVAEGLRLSRIPVSQPSRVFLTSLMPENVMGLDDLLFTGWRQDRNQPVQIFGPPGTRDFVASLLAAYGASKDALGDALALPTDAMQLDVTEVREGELVEWDGLSARAAAIEGGPLPALLWRFEAGGRSVVVSGVGWADERLVSFAQGADALVHEAVYVPPPEDVEAAGVIADPERLRRESLIHTSLLDVGVLAAKADVGTLILMRMRPPPFYDIQVTSHVAETFPGRVLIPEDGDEITP
jgi:ribonuclease Z